ncbi:Hypothetical protein SMAX5B_005786 [Scophthalmus maximus]|uniref:Uncharacterized protein n=1 Tax=Scophthalmus maximus TaxID=52904 RepID=A0A2U9BK66_SCOMX|nr:Hypothetical protein SMAX5B_005786 [Scophthalmus maximus]
MCVAAVVESQSTRCRGSRRGTSANGKQRSPMIKRGRVRPTRGTDAGDECRRERVVVVGEGADTASGSAPDRAIPSDHVLTLTTETRADSETGTTEFTVRSLD